MPNNCSEIESKGVSKVEAAYDPIIKETLKIIRNMKKKKLDPTRYYDAKHDKVINLEKFAKDLSKQKSDDIKEIKSQVKEKCLSNEEKILQYIIDLAVLRYTKGLSAILPKHFTHIDVKELLKGKILGGKNSIFNKIRDDIFNKAGFGKNNTLRKILENPKKELEETVKKLRITIKIESPF